MSVAAPNGGGGDLLALALAAQSDTAFQKRFTELTDAAKAADAAFKALKVGQDAATVYDEATAVKAQAEQALAQAAQRADEIVANAQAQALEIIQGAEAKGSEILEARKRQAERFLADAVTAKTEADSHHMVAKATAEQAKATADTVRQAKAALDQQQIDFAKLREGVEAERKRLTAVATTLRAALGQLDE